MTGVQRHRNRAIVLKTVVGSCVGHKGDPEHIFDIDIDASIKRMEMARARADQKTLWFDQVPEFVHDSGWLEHKA